MARCFFADTPRFLGFFVACGSSPAFQRQLRKSRGHADLESFHSCAGTATIYCKCGALPHAPSPCELHSFDRKEHACADNADNMPLTPCGSLRTFPSSPRLSFLANHPAYLPTQRCSRATSSPLAPSALADPDGSVSAPVPEVAGGSPWPGTGATFSRGTTFRSGCRQPRPPWRKIKNPMCKKLAGDFFVALWP